MSWSCARTARRSPPLIKDDLELPKEANVEVLDINADRSITIPVCSWRWCVVVEYEW